MSTITTTAANVASGDPATAAQYNALVTDLNALLASLFSSPSGSTYTTTNIRGLLLESLIIPGAITQYGGSAAPSGWLLCDGTAYDNGTYSALFDVILDQFGQGALVTVTANATTDVLTASSHGMSNGQRITFSTTNTLPGGISANTRYFVINQTTNTFQISLTAGGSAVNITSTGSGTQRYSKQFKTPDLRGRVPVGLDSGDSSFNVMGETGGSKTHTLSTSEIPSHTHAAANSGNFLLTQVSGGATGYAAGGNYALTAQVANTDSAGGGGSHNNLQPYMAINNIIKT